MVIIGAGISGLSTGIYARLGGYDATVLEMHSQPVGSALPGRGTATFLTAASIGLWARQKGARFIMSTGR